MKKKLILCGVYLLGWLYPLSIVAFNIADRYLKIKEPYACPFDFNCDAMIGWCFCGLLIALVSFLIFFITVIVRYKTRKTFYLTILNLPILLYILVFGWTSTYGEILMLNMILLAVCLALIVLSLAPVFRAEYKKA